MNYLTQKKRTEGWGGEGGGPAGKTTSHKKRLFKMSQAASPAAKVLGQPRGAATEAKRKLAADDDEDDDDDDEDTDNASLLPHTGCGLKSPNARVQPLTRAPEADETKTMTVTLPHRA